MDIYKEQRPLGKHEFQFEYSHATAPHDHDFIEILYGMTGLSEIFLGQNREVFGEGDMVLICSGEVHSVCPSGDLPNCYAVLKFAPEMVYQNCQDHGDLKYLLPLLFQGYSGHWVLHRGELKPTDIDALIADFIREVTEKAPGYELAARADLMKTFLKYCRCIRRAWHGGAPV